MSPKAMIYLGVIAVLAAIRTFGGDFAINLANYIGVYTVVVLGIVLLTGIGGMTSFGQAAFVGIGAYATGYATTAMGFNPWGGLLFSLAIVALSAWVIGLLTLRLQGHFLPLSTIAWAVALYYLFGNLDLLGGNSGLDGIPPVRIFGASLEGSRQMFLLIWASVLGSTILIFNVLDSRPGRALKSLKGGVKLAEAFGVNTAQYRIKLFVLAALLAALSGWLYAHLLRFINPTPFGLNVGIEYLFMAVVGGVSQIWGAVVGVVAITLSKEVLQDVLPFLVGQNGSRYELIVFGAVLIVLLHMAPEGFLYPVRHWFMERRRPTDNQGTRPLDLPIRDKPVPTSVLLDVNGVTKRFGGLVALNDVTFRVSAGEIVGVIGPNGAGKSTLFDLITGVQRPTSGTIVFAGKHLDNRPSREIASHGLARTFQHVKLLPTLSVLENTMIGAHTRAKAGIARAALRLDRREEAAIQLEAVRQVARVGLSEALDVETGTLALGKQRIVEIARALCADPILLLLDEPAAGLRLQEKVMLARLLRQLRDEGVTILVVEHDMDFVMSLVDRLVVLDFGERIAEGDPKAVQADSRVLEAYLGGIE